MQTDGELKPCPFCEPPTMAGIKKFKSIEGTNYANCFDCGAAASISEWNNAYCWKEISRLKEALSKEREKALDELLNRIKISETNLNESKGIFIGDIGAGMKRGCELLFEHIKEEILKLKSSREG